MLLQFNVPWLGCFCLLTCCKTFLSMLGLRPICGFKTGAGRLGSGDLTGLDAKSLDRRTPVCSMAGFDTRLSSEYLLVSLCPFPGLTKHSSSGSSSKEADLALVARNFFPVRSSWGNRGGGGKGKRSKDSLNLTPFLTVLLLSLLSDLFLGFFLMVPPSGESQLKPSSMPVEAWDDFSLRLPVELDLWTR